MKTTTENIEVHLGWYYNCLWEGETMTPVDPRINLRQVLRERGYCCIAQTDVKEIWIRKELKK